MINVDGIFDGLIAASFRGLDFWMPDTRLTVGRRVQQFLFPGRDDKVWEDLGALDGPITFRGILIGDDFVSQAQAWRLALRTPGSAVLVHPWLGELVVILAQPGTISFDEHELRVARVELTVELYAPDDPPPVDTLGAVDDGVTDVQTAAAGLVAAILTPATLTLAAIGVVEDVCETVAGIYTAAVGTVGVVASAIGADIAALGNVGTLIVDAISAPAALAALLLAPATDIVGTSATLLPAAIGPGDAAPASTTQDPRATAAMLLAATSAIVAIAGVDPTAATALAAAAISVSAAVSAATDIAYTSQQDAQDWQAQLLAGIDQAAGLAVSVAPLLPATAGPVWHTLQALRAAVAADINAQIGRLPVVQTYTLAGTVPAWLVAQALVGDTPAQLLAMYTDLVARNDVYNPSMMGPGAIEALVA